jgi:predicted dehydrogenase
MKKIRWGVISTARIGMKQVIPAFQRSELCEVTAIASRTGQNAARAAETLGIEKAYASYEELLSDPQIEAIYNPLPNHLHMDWSIKAMEAGKHVLCEKPLGLSEDEVLHMISARDRCGVKAGEAFMVKSHPQWLDTRERVRRGEVGKLRLIQGMFSYYNADPENIRNIREFGGGGMWDIGCYCVTMSRYIFEEEPLAVCALLEYDPVMGTDRLGSVLMDFPSGQSQFAVSTQLVPYQRMHFFGTSGHLEVEIPWNAPGDRPCRVTMDNGDILRENVHVHEYPVADQYTLMGDAFSKAIIDGTEVPVSLEDALLNTRALNAIFESARTAQWIKV